MRVFVCALWALALWARGVSAQAPAPVPPAPELACPAGDVPHVDGELVLAASEALLAAKLAGHLRAALSARGIVFCMRSPQPGSTASLRIRVESGARAAIEISDALTEKHIARSVDLGRLPRDGWALALAASSDELLRASWAELAMRDAPKPRMDAPPAVVRAITASVGPDPLRKIELAPEFSAQWQRWRTAFGARLRFAYWLKPSWALLLGAASSFGLRVASSHGSVRADTLDLEFGAAYALPSAQAHFGATLELNAVVSRVAFSARANAQGASDSFEDWSLAGLARLRGFYGAGPWRISAALGVLAPLRPASARDEGKTVTATRGFGGEAVLGLGAFF
jgi:hypothetical protein